MSGDRFSYTAIAEIPHDLDEKLAFVVEKIREVAYPRLLVVVEADDRSQLAQIVDDLNIELRSRFCPALDVADFSEGVR